MCAVAQMMNCIDVHSGRVVDEAGEAQASQTESVLAISPDVRWVDTWLQLVLVVLLL